MNAVSNDTISHSMKPRPMIKPGNPAQDDFIFLNTPLPTTGTRVYFQFEDMDYGMARFEVLKVDIENDRVELLGIDIPAYSRVISVASFQKGVHLMNRFLSEVSLLSRLQLQNLLQVDDL